MPRPTIPIADRKVPFTINMTVADRAAYRAACFTDGQQSPAVVARRLLLEYSARIQQARRTGGA